MQELKEIDLAQNCFVDAIGDMNFTLSTISTIYFYSEANKHVVQHSKCYRLKTQQFNDYYKWFSELVKDEGHYVFTPANTRRHINTPAKLVYCWVDGETYYFETNFIKLM